MDIDILLKSIWKDIFFTLFGVLISIPVWLSFDVKDASSIAKANSNLKYTNYYLLNDKVDNYLNSVSDDYARKNIETQDILVYNNSNVLEEYRLIFKLYKKSSISTDKIKLNLNNNIYYLSQFNYYEDDDAIYYILDTDYLVSSSQKYVISFWNDQSAIINDDAFLNYEYIVI